MPTDRKEHSPRVYARAAGLLYLLMVLAPGVMHVPDGVLVSGDPAATVRNLQETEGLFRLGILGHLWILACDVGVLVLFYLLLRPVSQVLSLAAAATRMTLVAIMGLNLIHPLMALRLITDAAFASAFEPPQVQALVQGRLEAFALGFDLAMVFFSLHLILIGILFHRSDYVPKLLSALLPLSACAYLANSLGSMFLPGFAEAAFRGAFVTGAVLELGFAAWLLVLGVRVSATAGGGAAAAGRG